MVHINVLRAPRYLIHLGALADAGTANTTQSAITKTVVEPSTLSRSCMKTTLNEPKEPMPAAAQAYPLKKNLAAGRLLFKVVQLFQTSFNAVKNNEAPSGSCFVGAWSRKAQLTISLLPVQTHA